MIITSFMLNIFSGIDLQTFFLGEDPAEFLGEVFLRTLVMFIVVLVGLRFLGKRSVAQLSVFEIGVIIALGSAAGDPMLYKDVGILPSILAFAVILTLYRFITFLINYNSSAEKVLEGVPVYIAEHGAMHVENFEKEQIAHEEFFAQLRLRHVTHMGQLKFAILETNGSVSIVFYPDEKVKWGLPILPHLCADKTVRVSEVGIYACTYCGNTEEVTTLQNGIQCNTCGRNEWVAAINEPRVT